MVAIKIRKRGFKKVLKLNNVGFERDFGKKIKDMDICKITVMMILF